MARSPDHATIDPTNPVLPGSLQDAARRSLLALVTALVVARPLVVGEDPGLTSGLSDPTTLVLTLLWLVAAAGWFAWRLWAGVNRYVGGLVEVALLAVVGLLTVSAAVAAPYKQPAFLIAWEWLALLAAYVVVRQLAVQPGEQHGLFCALLATVVSLSVYAVYQAFVELPATARLMGTTLEQMRAVVAQYQPELSGDNPTLYQIARRVQGGHAFATYAHPNTFAGLLDLVLPALVGGVIGGALACRRQKNSPALTIAVGVCAGFGLLALWVTHSRGAMLALLVVGGFCGLVAGRRWVRRHLAWAAAGLVAVVLSLYLLWLGGLFTSAMGKDTTEDRLSTAALRWQYWQTTAAMIDDHPWLGVGPGNFGRFYGRYVTSPDAERIQDPHNFVLELWATAGPFAALALAAALVCFFVALLRRRPGEPGASATGAGTLAGAGVSAALRSPAITEKPDAPATPVTTTPKSAVKAAPVAHAPGSPGSKKKHRDVKEPLRWEFYLGGMGGLLLGLVLRLQDRSPDAILGEGLTAAGRSLLWFVAYAILERNVWPARARALALGAGVAALLLNLCVSGGIGFPSLALFLWVAMALALNARDATGTACGNGQRVLLALAVPVTICLIAFYCLTALAPINSTIATLRNVRGISEAYELDQQKAPEKRQIKPGRETTFINRALLEPLRKAARDDPGNARLAEELATWYRECWKLLIMDPTSPENREKWGVDALKLADRARKLDPEGRTPYLVASELHRQFGRTLAFSPKAGLVLGLPYESWRRSAFQTEQRQQDARKQSRRAAEVLVELVLKDPTDAWTHAALADIWFQAGEIDKALREAKRALDLDSQTAPERSRLTDAQREQLGYWLQDRPAR